MSDSHSNVCLLWSCWTHRIDCSQVCFNFHLIKLTAHIFGAHLYMHHYSNVILRVLPSLSLQREQADWTCHFIFTKCLFWEKNLPKWVEKTLNVMTKSTQVGTVYPQRLLFAQVCVHKKEKRQCNVSLWMPFSTDWEELTHCAASISVVGEDVIILDCKKRSL